LAVLAEGLKTVESILQEITKKKRTLISALSRLPSKWFDWLKWILIIGAFSIIEKKQQDSYLEYIIFLSYAAVLLDTYIEVGYLLNYIKDASNMAIDGMLGYIMYVRRNTDNLSLHRKIDGILSFLDFSKYLIDILSILGAILVTSITYKIINYLVDLYVSSDGIV
jgi:hypothetical protein